MKPIHQVINEWNAKVESSPFSQGLKASEAMELVRATRAPSQELQRKYHKTAHFAKLKQTAIAIHGRCQVCHNVPLEMSMLTFHHVTYRNLFEEDVIRDGLLVCRRCHRRLHGKG